MSPRMDTSTMTCAQARETADRLATDVRTATTDTAGQDAALRSASARRRAMRDAMTDREWRNNA